MTQAGAQAASKQTEADYGTPKIDAADALWDNAPEIPVNRHLPAWGGGERESLPDNKKLYVLVTAHNAAMNKTNANPQE
jgi:hypothetical protein